MEEPIKAFPALTALFCYDATAPGARSGLRDVLSSHMSGNLGATPAGAMGNRRDC